MLIATKKTQAMKLYVGMPQKEICSEVGCTMSQFGWAVYIGRIDPSNMKSVVDWVKCVKKAYKGIIPARIDYRYVPKFV
jgi:hypothetical protein